ncbi:hypothetical protein EDD11_001039 [Mortierella claussenii]|nr:hypothetical protein EDD11_001039 [Mortierella claussenii]
MPLPRPLPSPKSTPIELPEILHYLAPLVSLQDQLSCVRVCRQWHASFTPFIWSTFTVPDNWSLSPSRPSSPFPSLEVLKRHAHFIRSLTLGATAGLQPFLERCVSLKMLVVHGCHIRDPHPDLWDKWMVDLVRRNPGIEWIMFGFEDTSAPSTAFLKALPEACPQLKRYESSMGKYEDADQVEALMQLFGKLECVSSRYEWFVRLPDVKRTASWRFPALKDLTLKDLRGLSTEGQVEWMCQCPRLQHLKWTMAKDRYFPVPTFCRLIPKACPELSKLQMDGCGLRHANDIGKMLGAMTRLDLLAVTGSRISQETFKSLSRHFGTLRCVDLMYCSQVKSWMVQTMLEEAQGLERLQCQELKMTDIVHGKKWRAQGMKQMEVNIRSSRGQRSSQKAIRHGMNGGGGGGGAGVVAGDMERQEAILMEEQWATFEQLSKLTLLEELSSGPRRWGCGPRRAGVIYRIESGMDQLRTLTRLRVLKMGECFQAMTEQDVRWIGDHLKQLHKVDGVFSMDRQQHLKMAHGLRENYGVEVPEVDGYVWNEYGGERDEEEYGGESSDGGGEEDEEDEDDYEYAEVGDEEYYDYSEEETEEEEEQEEEGGSAVAVATDSTDATAAVGANGLVDQEQPAAGLMERTSKTEEAD